MSRHRQVHVIDFSDHSNEQLMKFTLISAAAIALALAGVAGAQQAGMKRDLPDSLMKEAKVTESAALAVAKKAVPKGEVAAIELEREGGKLIYSMDVKTPGKSGIDEVNVDARLSRCLHVHRVDQLPTLAFELDGGDLALRHGLLRNGERCRLGDLCFLHERVRKVALHTGLLGAGDAGERQCDRSGGDQSEFHELLI